MQAVVDGGQRDAHVVGHGLGMQLLGRHMAVAAAGRLEQQLGKRQALAGRAQSCCLEALDQRAVGTILAHGSRYKVPACPIKVAKTVSCQLLLNRYKRLSLASAPASGAKRSEEHTSELPSLMRISYDGFC